MIDQELKESLKRKIEEGEFEAADIPDYLALFCEMGSEVEDLQEEVEGWDRRINFVLEGAPSHWISVEDGRFATAEGTLKDADFVLKMDATDAARIFSGDMDATAAFLSGAIKIEGELPDATKMQTLLAIVGEEIDY